MTRYKLRDYQSEAVAATIKHFRQSNESAVIVLPTGSGKSLVIAELARLARKKILVLTHVKELVEQNFQKYQSLGLEAGIYSAGLALKQVQYQVTFASIQSVARNLDVFKNEYSLIIVDECHRVNLDEQQAQPEKTSSSNQYQKVISQLKNINPEIKLLGLTATPYRLGMGWIYQKHYRGIVRSEDKKPFDHCIYELPLRYLIKKQFLTPPKLVDATIEHYDFSSLKENAFGEYNKSEINHLLAKNPRVTQGIIEQVIELAEQRKGVMIFAATVEHAQEILTYLANENSAIITGSTENKQRDKLIEDFKQQKIKFLVNVSVLTTGFDAPHVDMIAILRPTQSVSLFQQIIGRGLRLSEDKKDCLIIDYTGNDFDLYQPEVGEKKPNKQSQPVQVICPSCEFANIFWGICDDDGHIIEHYGRRCQGLVDNQQCDYRFVFKECKHCGEENDIAARKCIHCHEIIIDPDDMLKKALQLKDAKVLRCSGISLEKNISMKNGARKELLKVTYHDEDGSELSEQFNFSSNSQKDKFNSLFAKRLAIKLESQQAIYLNTVDQVMAVSNYLPSPDFVIARKDKYYWKIKERLFDYQGNYRKANQLG